MDETTALRGHRLGELRLLYRVSSELNAQREPDRVIAVALDSLEALFAPDHCCVYLFDSELDRLVRTASRGAPVPGMGERVRRGSGIVGAVAAKREIVRVNYRADPLAPETEIESRMGIPMLATDELMGVLFVRSRGETILRQADEPVVTILANQAAVALQNARLYRGLAQLNADLEQRVRDRTAELEQKNLELQRAQAQLVQSGKMATLGQLAAGLSHEMNTPLGAIRASADVADRAIAMLDAAGLTRDGQGERDGRGERGERGRIDKAMGVLSDATRVTRDASTRLHSVFEALRSFARLDEAEHQHADLHDGLQSTLDLLGHRLGTRIGVVQERGELPRVLCHAGELNQVFLIVLTNAAEAIEGEGRVTIRTRARDGAVEIEIADSGRGISREQLGRIFDPAFTTKGTRIGAGLSLAIAHSVMDRHGGSIEIDSELGRGTTVRLRLPLDGAR